MCVAFSAAGDASSRAPIGVLFDDRCWQHDPGPGHPERPERLDVIRRALAAPPLAGAWRPLTPRLCDDAAIEAVHDPAYVALARRAIEAGMPGLPTGDTAVSRDSLLAARAAAGGILSACDAVMAGEVAAAFCAIRPPGHHATRNRGMGFCVFNNVAIGARYLQRQHGIERVLIVDWDVHHGNGTYDIFRADPSVLQFHLHQRGIYPGTGWEDETGEGAAQGRVIHIPLLPGSGVGPMLEAIERKLVPAARAFRPQFVLISAGFDAHRRDPIGGLDLGSADYGRLTDAIADIADEHAGGRIVSVLEGGYDLQALGESVAAHIATLARRAAGRATVNRDPLPPAPAR